jgi:1,4-alpha-glucan branching enzyme/maltooligosyltrehalose trehalohydrolase
MLDWSELNEPDHQRMLNLHRELLDLRLAEIVPRLAGAPGGSAVVEWNKNAAFLVSWRLGDASVLRLLANLSPEPAKGAPPRPNGSLIFANFEMQGAESGSLLPWSVAWFLDGAEETAP